MAKNILEWPMVEEGWEEQKPQKARLHRQPPLATRETKELDKTMEEKDKNPTEVCRRRSLAILLRGACIIISTSRSSSESWSLPTPEGKEGDGLTYRWKKRKRVRSIIETMHIKWIDTLVERNLPLSAMEGTPEPEVSIVEPERAGETLEVFPALSHWIIRVCRDLKTGGYIKDRLSSLRNISKDCLALPNS